jgi:hypothetical protein
MLKLRRRTDVKTPQSHKTLIFRRIIDVVQSFLVQNLGPFVSIGEDFVKKILHRRPGTVVGRGVVADVGNMVSIGIGDCKRVVGATVDDHLPIDISLAHFILESRYLLG